MSRPEEDEVAFYRAVEDQFAALRGTPFLFSPKDFALLREWWRAGVPLAAVLAGIGEAWERRRERGEDPVSSLSYCRHAVKRHARRLGVARVGASVASPEFDAGAALAALTALVTAVAERWSAVPPVAAIVHDLARAIASLPPDGDPSALDETLANLEYGTLAALEGALPEDVASELRGSVAGELAGLGLEADVLERTRRALTIKAARRLVGLPRLEISAGAS